MEEQILTGHPAQEPEVEETESQEGRAFQTLEEYEEAFRKLADEEMTAAEKEAQLLAETEEREARERAEREFRETAREIRRKHLARTRDFDPDEEDFDDSVAETWADSDAEVQAARERAFRDASRPSEAAAVRWAVGYRDAQAIRAGIDPSDPAFQKVCEETPASVGTFQEQVDHAVKAYIERHGKREEPSEDTVSSIDDVLEASEGARRLDLSDFNHGR